MACANMMVCRVCLSVNTKQYSIRQYKLKEIYEDLTGLCSTDEKLPQKVCWECAHRLNSFSRYKSMALRSHKLIQDLLHSKQCLTFEDINSINRESHHLTSILTQIAPQYYDVGFHNNIKMIKEENLTNNNCQDDEDNCQDDFHRMKMSPTYEGSQENLDIKLDTEDFDETLEYCNTLEEEDKISLNNIDINGTRETGLLSGKREVDNLSTSKLSFVIKDYTFILNNDCSPIVTKKKESEPISDTLEANQSPPDVPHDIKNFTITRLSVDEQIAELQQKQHSTWYKKSALKCTTCYKAFSDEDTYKSHMLRHTDKCGVHVCTICKLHFDSCHILKIHCMRTHWYRFNCNLCKFAANASLLAKAHSKWHSGVRWKCAHCQEIFQMPSSYRNHLRIQHPSDVVCTLCGDAFVSRQGLQSHKRLKHYGHDLDIPDEGPRCDSCDVRFANRAAYERHLVRSSRHRTPYDPSKKRGLRPPRDLHENAQKKSLKSAWNKEKKWTKESGPIKCEQCDAELATPRAYGYHFRRHHPGATRTFYPTWDEPYMCEICGKMYKNAFFFREHSYTHGDTKHFKCDVCDKRFYKSVDLTAHRRRHTDTRHSCPTCGKTFIDPSNMQRHIKIHTGLKPYTCEWCGKTFSQAHVLKSHVQCVHMKKPWPKRVRKKKQKTHFPKTPPAPASLADAN